MGLVDAFVGSAELCMLVSSIASQVGQTLDEVVTGSPDFARLLYESPGFPVSKSHCTHIHVNLFDLWVLSYFLPDWQLVQIRVVWFF